MRTSILEMKSNTMKKNQFLRYHKHYFNRLLMYFIFLLFGFMHFRTSINVFFDNNYGLWNITSAIIFILLLILGFFGFFFYLKKIRVLCDDYKNS